MDELHRGRKLVVVVAFVPAKARARQGQDRAQALAARCDDMTRQLRDQHDRGLHLVDDGGIHELQVGLDQGTQISKRLLLLLVDLRGSGDDGQG